MSEKLSIEASDLSQIVAVDVETTGLSPNRDRIVEVALVGLDQSANPDWSWQSLVNPGRQIPAQATEIHGITGREVGCAPTFADLVDEILERLQGKVVLAHNLKFDAGFLRAEIRRAGRPLPSLHGVDTLALARQYGWQAGSSYRLGDLCRHYGIQTSHLHRALGDARATCLLLQRMLGIANESTDPWALGNER